MFTRQYQTFKMKKKLMKIITSHCIPFCVLVRLKKKSKLVLFSIRVNRNITHTTNQPIILSDIFIIQFKFEAVS